MSQFTQPDVIQAFRDTWRTTSGRIVLMTLIAESRALSPELAPTRELEAVGAFGRRILFLTGLTPENVQALMDAVASAPIKDQDREMEDPFDG